MRKFGESTGLARLHSTQCACVECGLVFSNPVADETDLDHFYKEEYWEQHWPDALRRDAASVKRAVDEQRPEVSRVVAHGGRGKLLEVGSGTGTFLAAARDAQFDVWGIETSEAAATHSREVFDFANVITGSMPDARLADESFDVVVAWHVIEHVVDLDAFVDSLRAALKKNGLLWIGTENYRNASHYLERGIALAKRRPPPFATATEHTLVFDRKTLTDVFRRRGFTVEMCEVYQPSLVEKQRTMKFRNPLSRLYFDLQHAANALFGTGPLMRLAARKR